MHPGLADRGPTGAGRTDQRRCHRGCRSLGQAATRGAHFSTPSASARGNSCSRHDDARAPFHHRAPPRASSADLARRSSLRGPPLPAPATAPISATAQLAGRLAADLAVAAKEAVVFVGPIRSDEPAPRGVELAGKLAGWLAGALGGGASARAESVSLATAQAIAHGKSLVYVEIEIAADSFAQPPMPTARLAMYGTAPANRSRHPSLTARSQCASTARYDRTSRRFRSSRTASKR